MKKEEKPIKFIHHADIKSDDREDEAQRIIKKIKKILHEQVDD